MSLAPAWIPFLEPMDLHGQLAALGVMVPLVVGICLFYKAIKVEDLRQLPRESVRLTATVLGAMMLAAVVLWAVMFQLVD